MKEDNVRINVQLSRDLVKKVDEYAERMHITRTSALSVIISIFLTGNKI